MTFHIFVKRKAGILLGFHLLSLTTLALPQGMLYLNQKLFLFFVAGWVELG